MADMTRDVNTEHPQTQTPQTQILAKVILLLTNTL